MTTRRSSRLCARSWNERVWASPPSPQPTPRRSILVDIFLGEESGFELARHLAEDGRGQGDAATVILISTHAEADLADLIAASPAAGFLPKAELSAKAIRRKNRKSP